MPIFPSAGLRLPDGSLSTDGHAAFRSACAQQGETDAYKKVVAKAHGSYHGNEAAEAGFRRRGHAARGGREIDLQHVPQISADVGQRPAVLKA